MWIWVIRVSTRKVFVFSEFLVVVVVLFVAFAIVIGFIFHCSSVLATLCKWWFCLLARSYKDELFSSFVWVIICWAAPAQPCATVFPCFELVDVVVFGCGHATLHFAVLVGPSSQMFLQILLLCRSVRHHKYYWIASGYPLTAPAQLSATVLPCIQPCFHHSPPPYLCPSSFSSSSSSIKLSPKCVKALGT